MGKVTNNNFTRGISGAVSEDMVFRKYKGETVVYVKPSRTAPPSEKEIAHRLKFKEATIYAKNAINDPLLKAEYQAFANQYDMDSAYIVAVTDYLKAPEISLIDASGYKGVAGNKILIRATDDFKVTSVQVSIINANGTEVESGQAIQSPNKVTWEYIANQANLTYIGDKIKVTATDLPGNTTVLEQII